MNELNPPRNVDRCCWKCGGRVVVCETLLDDPALCARCIEAGDEEPANPVRCVHCKAALDADQGPANHHCRANCGSGLCPACNADTKGCGDAPAPMAVPDPSQLVTAKRRGFEAPPCRDQPHRMLGEPALPGDLMCACGGFRRVLAPPSGGEAECPRAQRREGRRAPMTMLRVALLAVLLSLSLAGCCCAHVSFSDETESVLEDEVVVRSWCLRCKQSLGTGRAWVEWKGDERR